jgi:hypothetical protein
MNADAEKGEARFWELAAPLLEQAGITRSTMMGFPCLRLHGDFFATCDRRSGDLVVKLDEEQITRLIDAGLRTQRQTIPRVGRDPLRATTYLERPARRRPGRRGHPRRSGPVAASDRAL